MGAFADGWEEVAGGGPAWRGITEAFLWRSGGRTSGRGSGGRGWRRHREVNGTGLRGAADW